MRYMWIIYDDKQIIESYIDAKKLATLDLLRLSNKLSVRLVDCDGGTKVNSLTFPIINENGNLPSF